MRVTLVIEMEKDAAPESVMMVVQHLKGVREVSGTVVRNPKPPPPAPLGPTPKPKVTPKPRMAAQYAAQAARSMGYTGDMCLQCGQFTMKRSGTCLTCQTCGVTTGCS